MTEPTSTNSGDSSPAPPHSKDADTGGESPARDAAPPRRRRLRPWRWVFGGLATILVIAVAVPLIYLWQLSQTVSDNIVHEPLLPEQARTVEPQEQGTDSSTDSPEDDGDDRQTENNGTDAEGEGGEGAGNGTDAEGEGGDAEGEGNPDLVEGEGGTSGTDTNGDGVADVNIDIDGDNEPDINIDSDSDGVVDDAPEDDRGSEAPYAQPEPPADAEGAANFLIIGEDGTYDDGQHRSDVLILAHVSADREDVTLVHFPRDLYVPIPGYGQNKINAAYPIGGAPLVTKTLQGLVDVPIDHVAITDFQNFQAMTDAVGGVTVNNPVPGPDFPGGSITLNGDEALEFVRERKSLDQGDISRGQRQQAYLQGLMTDTLTRSTVTNPSRLSSVIDAATQNVRVDEGLSTAVMRDYALDLVGLSRGDVNFVTAPWSGLDMTPDGQSIVTVNESGMQQLSEALRTDTVDQFSSGSGNWP